MRPRIAIPLPHSTDLKYGERAFPQYASAVEAAGGEAVRIPLDQTPAEIMKLIERCDGVVLPGSPADVDRLCRDLFLSSRARERDDNLLFVRERLLRSEVDTSALLGLYERVLSEKTVPDDESSPLIYVLRLSGITRVENSRHKVRNRIYREVFNREWVTTNMPRA